MKISPAQQRIDYLRSEYRKMEEQRVRQYEQKVQREHQECVRKAEQKRAAKARNGAGIDVYV
jgi:hypothetical protein